MLKLGTLLRKVPYGLEIMLDRFLQRTEIG